MDPVQLRTEANSAYVGGDYELAERKYSDALAACEQMQDATDIHLIYANRSACRLKQGNPTGALKDAQMSHSVQPRFLKALYRSALALKDLGKLKEAMQQLDAATEVDATNKELAHYQPPLDSGPKMTQTTQGASPASQKATYPPSMSPRPTADLTGRSKKHIPWDS
eukprot:gene15723-21843_t